MPLDPQTGLPVTTPTPPSPTSTDPVFDPLAQISFDPQPTSATLNEVVSPSSPTPAVMPDLSQVVLPPSPFSDAEYVPESHLEPQLPVSVSSSVSDVSVVPPVEPVVADMVYHEPISDESYVPAQPLQPDVSKVDVPTMESQSSIEIPVITQHTAEETSSDPISSISIDQQTLEPQGDNNEAQSLTDKEVSSDRMTDDNNDPMDDSDVATEKMVTQDDLLPATPVSLDRESTYEDDRGEEEHPDMPVINAFYELGDTLKELLSVTQADDSVPYILEGKSSPDTHIQYSFLLVDRGNGLNITKITTQGDTIKEEVLAFEYDITSFSMKVLLNNMLVYTEGEDIPIEQSKRDLLLDKMDGFMDMMDVVIEQFEQQRQKDLEEQRQKEEQARQQQIIVEQLEQF